jgi:LysM repeat protein
VSASDVELAMVHAPARKVTSRSSASSSSSSRKQPSYRVHRVQRGQTLQQIARRYGTTVKALQGLNRVRRPGALQVGQRLLIPKSG